MMSWAVTVSATQTSLSAIWRINSSGSGARFFVADGLGVTEDQVRVQQVG